MEWSGGNAKSIHGFKTKLDIKNYGDGTAQALLFPTKQN